MHIETAYTKYPALRPTVLVHDALKNVYRPTEPLSALPVAAENPVTRETPRAA